MTKVKAKKIYDAIIKYDEAGRDFVEAIHTDSGNASAIGNYVIKHKKAFNDLLDAIGGMEDYKIKDVIDED